MGTRREGYPIVGREVEVHDMGLQDLYGREIQYQTTIEAIADPETPTTPRSWRIWGQQLRNGHKYGTGTRPLHLYSVREARTMAYTLVHRHRRHIERKTALYSVRAAAAEEDLTRLSERI